MSSVNKIEVSENGKKDLLSVINKKVSIKNDNTSQKDEGKTQNTEKEKEKEKTKSCKLIYIILTAVILLIIVAASIAILILLKKKNEDKEINQNNYIKVEMNDNFVIPSDGELQVVGADFQHKESIVIFGINNNKFIIDDKGTIQGVTKKNVPLYYSFNETITNGSYMFKDVQCFKAINLSKMDSSKMIDISYMFENSNFEEIYFGTENESYETNSEYNVEEIAENSNENSENNSSIRHLDENSENITEQTEAYFEEEEYSINESWTEYFEEEEYSINDNWTEYFEEEEDSKNEKRKEYFETKKIESASFIFKNCTNLKKIQFPPSFNVGKNAKGMFKGCSKLEEANISLISSNDIEEMESIFEDCHSLKEISFSNDFLTGEIKSLNNTFKIQIYPH